MTEAALLERADGDAVDLYEAEAGAIRAWFPPLAFAEFQKAFRALDLPRAGRPLRDALAAGGPILPPELRNMLILPIAPHLSLDRAVVLAEGVQVVLRAQSEFQVVLSVDGMDPIPLSADDTVQVAANQHSLRMVRFGEPNYFYRDLADVLHRNPVLQENHHDG